MGALTLHTGTIMVASLMLLYASHTFAQSVTGKATYYNPAGGIGACGQPIQDTDLAAALGCAISLPWSQPRHGQGFAETVQLTFGAAALDVNVGASQPTHPAWVSRKTKHIRLAPIEASGSSILLTLCMYNHAHAMGPRKPGQIDDNKHQARLQAK